MPGSGVCIVYPFNYGHAQHPLADAVSCVAHVFTRLLRGRDASGFDVCDLTDVVRRRALTADSPEVKRGKYPNAPYHSFIYLYYGFYSGIDYAGHIIQTPVNLPAQWVADLNSPGETVNHYVFGYVSPSDLHQVWPDGTEGPGVGPAEGGSTVPTGPADEFTLTIAGVTATAIHYGSKVHIAAIPHDVKPIMVNANGELAAWTFKDRWHYWYVPNMATLVMHSTFWYAFIFWVLAHITKVRGLNLVTNTIKVWLDIDDLARAGVTSWYAKIEADPEGVARFASAARVNGFGKPCLAMEANPDSLAGAPQTVAVIRRLGQTSRVMVTPHSHDWTDKIPDPRKIKTEADGVTYLNNSYANLSQQGLSSMRKYITMCGNYVSEPLVRACFSQGIILLRGGDWVSDMTRSEQPLHVAAASGTPARQRYAGYMYRTGQYGGLAVDTGYHFYDWDSLAIRSNDTMPGFKLRELNRNMRALLLGCDTTDNPGYIWKRVNQLAMHLVYHPSALTDADLGVETLNWLGSWNKVYTVYEGVDDPVRYINTGT